LIFFCPVKMCLLPCRPNVHPVMLWKNSILIFGITAMEATTAKSIRIANG